jgi:hypothetical protein
VKDACDIGRGDDNAIRFTVVVHLGVEETVFQPIVVPFFFAFFWIVVCGNHNAISYF